MENPIIQGVSTVQRVYIEALPQNSVKALEASDESITLAIDFTLSATTTPP